MDNWAQCILFVKHILTFIASIFKVIGTRNFSLFLTEFASANILSKLYAIATGVQDNGAISVASVATQVAAMTLKFKTVKAKMDALPTSLVDAEDYQVLLTGITGWGACLNNLESSSSGPSPAARLFGSSPTPSPYQLLVGTGAPDVVDLLKAIDDFTDCVTKVEDNKD